MGLFSKINKGLKKTRDSFMGAVKGVVNSFTKIDEEFFEELEEILVMSDMGMATTEDIMDKLRDKVKEKGITEPKDIYDELEAIISEMLGTDSELKINTKPSVILVVGVNGVGKTTSIGKMAAYLKSEGKDIILGAADTFRAAAIEQLEVWADRAEVQIVKSFQGSDPASVVYDTIQAAKARDKDVIICDTAGRLHNKKNLMAELEKMCRIIKRELPDSDVETLLVLDATTGQNAVNQAKQFAEVTDLSGIILTKLDGTAKGGIVVSINNELGLPVKFIGVGEQIDDLQPFDADSFAKSLFGEE